MTPQLDALVHVPSFDEQNTREGMETVTSQLAWVSQLLCLLRTPFPNKQSVREAARTVTP